MFLDKDFVPFNNILMLIYRTADLDDLKSICVFTDYWLSGRGKRHGAIGAIDDCFISPRQNKKYIEKYYTLFCIDGLEIVGWAVLEPSGTLIHLFVAGNYRGRGIGKKMMQILSPKIVRSKSDQTSGNPIGFYEKLGYQKVATEKSRSRFDIDELKPDRKPNIDILRAQNSAK